MTEFGTLLDANTLRMERLLPGPIEKVWAYLTEGDKRAKWLAGGDMAQAAGGQLELKFQHSNLTPYEDDLPTGATSCSGESTMPATVLAYEPYNHLSYTWEEGTDDASEVTFDLAEVDDKVRLTLTHKRLVGADRILGVSAGWHTHIGILASVLADKTPDRFWQAFYKNQEAYKKRHQLA